MTFGIFISVDDSFNVFSPNGRSCTCNELLEMVELLQWFLYSGTLFRSKLYTSAMEHQVISCNAISVASDIWYPLLNSSEVDLISKDGENLPTAALVTGIFVAFC